jgi:hypothetical protein
VEISLKPFPSNSRLHEPPTRSLSPHCRLPCINIKSLFGLEAAFGTVYFDVAVANVVSPRVQLPSPYL